MAFVRWSLLLSLVALTLPALGLAFVPGAPAEPVAPCDWVDVPGQGPSCAVEGGWLVRLRDGSTVLTHGGDELPPDDGAHAFAHAAAPVCVASPATERHNLLVYAHASDRADRGATLAAQLRGLVASANGKLQHEAAEFGASANYKFRCAAGQPALVTARLATPFAQASFASLVSDMQALGHTDPLVKYWVWYDGQPPANPFGGQANIWSDTRADPANRHASGPDYAFTYGFMSWSLMMHESGHNLGAVQLTAPRTSGAWHCNDGQDVMCYADGGSRSAYNPGVCASEHFDCNHDDYFHPRPAAASYLWANWNLGSPLNAFVDFGPAACAVVRSATLLAPAPLGLGLEGLSQRHEPNLPAACEGRRFVLRGSLQAGPFTVGNTALVANFDVCWNDAAGALLACHSVIGADEGTVPVGARTARVFLQSGASSTYTLFVS